MPGNFTGVLERPLLKRSIHYIKKIDPSIERVLLLFDSGVTAQAVFKETIYEKSTLIISGVAVDIVLISSWITWQETVKKAGKTYDALIIGLYHTINDTAGNHKDSEDIIRWTSENSEIPPFGFWDFSIGSDKAIGGLVLLEKSREIWRPRLPG